MTDYFLHLYHLLIAYPILQGFLIAAATLLCEDGVVLATAALVTAGELDWITAFLGLTFGIVIGDVALYLAGRFAADFMIRRKWVSPQRLIRYEALFTAHTAKTVFLARFIPGTRTITFLAVGILRTPFWRFTSLAFIASVLQSTLVVGLSHFLGETAKGFITNPYVKLSLGIIVVAIVILANLRFTKKRKQQDETFDADLKHTETPYAPFEFWPPLFFYIPTFCYYLWLSLKHFSFRLPLNSNPSIYASGVDSESKIDIYSLLTNSPLCREFLAPVVHIPARPGAPLQTRLEDARAVLADAPFTYPFVAKPDIGQRGMGIRRIRDANELRDYLARYPDHQPVIFQQLITFPHEAGVLYTRFPDEPASGRIASFAIKEFPFITGDGKHTVRQLILTDTRKQKIAKTYFTKQAAILDTIPPPGERIQLNFTGNHAQGSIFWDRNHALTPALSARFCALAESLPEIYYARFDVRYRDYDAFLRGEDFQIVELNGAGAEPIHMYDPHRTLSETYAILRWQFATLFEIGRQNLARGVNSMITLRQFLKDLRRVQKLLKSYPPSE